MKKTNMGKRLAELRAERKETQEFVAEAIGISTEYLSKIENDKKMPSLEVIMLLKEYYDISLDYLLCGKKEQKCDIIRLWENLDNCTQRMVRSIMESVVNNVVEYEQEKRIMEKEQV
ncbi:MAG: helix-turn-helix transcriptional regulator [Lachnospiraceae bacterium]|nr:helix-turn-helix transcriptional regulator [Lachnospiraceae bacterium]